MSFTLEEKLALRSTIKEYLTDNPISKSNPKFLKAISEPIKGKIKKSQLRDVLLCNDFNIKSTDLETLNEFIQLEDNSLNKVEAIFDKPVDKMSIDELLGVSAKLMMLSKDQFVELSREYGFENNHFFSYHFDQAVVPNYLKLMGVESIKEKIIGKILTDDTLDFDYFDNNFRNEFNPENPRLKELKENDFSGLNEFISRSINRSKEYLDVYVQDKSELEKIQTIPSPVLLAEKTLKLDVEPYDIKFDQAGNLVVLGSYKKHSDSINPISARMSLSIYDINTGELINSRNTNINSLIGTFITDAHSNYNTLTIGSDGTLYVVGGESGIYDPKIVEKFSPTLERLTGSENNLMDAISLLESKGYFNSAKRIHQVIEDNGIFYFAIEPNFFPKVFENSIVATDSDKIIGNPIIDYTTSGWSNHGNEDVTARMVIQDDKLYFKSDKKILAVDKNLSEESLRNPYVMIEEEGFIPSNHCLSSNGIAYAVLRAKSTSCIKGYKRGEEKGEFATFVFPEDPFLGGLENIRTMDISKDNILAYTSMLDNKAHLYKLNE